MKDRIVIGCDGHPYIERDIDPLEDSGGPSCEETVEPPADDEQPLVGTGIVGTTGGEICEHDWEIVHDWDGDPEVIGGTRDFSFYRCALCGEEDHEREVEPYQREEDDVI